MHEIVHKYAFFLNVHTFNIFLMYTPIHTKVFMHKYTRNIIHTKYKYLDGDLLVHDLLGLPFDLNKKMSQENSQEHEMYVFFIDSCEYSEMYK